MKDGKIKLKGLKALGEALGMGASRQPAPKSLREAAKQNAARQPAKLSAGAEIRPEARGAVKSSAEASHAPVAKASLKPTQKLGIRPSPKALVVQKKPDFRFEQLPDERPTARQAYANFPANKNLASVAPEELRDAAALDFVLDAIRDVRFSIAEPRAESCSEELRTILERRVALGAELLRRRPEPDDDGYIVGVDFGTSSTKIVLHQPFAAGDPAAALPVPDVLRAEQIEHLWQTVVWFNPVDQLFSLAPSPHTVAIDGFKAGLIQRAGGKADQANVPRCMAATAFLAKIFAYVIGYYAEARPFGSVGAEQFSAFHLGVPVASKDDPVVFPEFLRVAAAAITLAQNADRLTLTLVDQAYRQAAGVRSERELVGVRLFTELEGVIAGYLATPDRAPGAHMVVDVGASTLDVATFRIYSEDGDLRVNVYASAVEMLGAQALEWARVADVPDICFKRAGWRHTWKPFHYTRTRKDHGFDRTRSSEPVRFLFIGGGRRSQVHEEMFTQPEKDLYLGAPTATPRPQDVAVGGNDVDFARLLVAYGLSRDPIQIPRIRLPSEMEDEPRRARDFTESFPSKDVAQ